MAKSTINDALAQRICHPGVIMALPSDAFYRDVMRWYGWFALGHADARLAEETKAYRSGGCKVMQLR